MGLKVDESLPVFAVVSRLTSQKGLDTVLQALPELLAQGGQLALLGAGDAVLQQAFLAAAADYPEQVGVQIGYHESFSHRIIGGADVILVPSRFEPCGLTQLYGLKYGTLPLVRRTGGHSRLRWWTARWKIWPTAPPAASCSTIAMPSRWATPSAAPWCCGAGRNTGATFSATP